MCYVIQRSDVSSFQPSIVDPEYREAFQTAMASGVEIITMVIQWTIFGEAFLVTDHLPINSL
jgi:DNA-binding sugar fermentation-stimulating protein